MNLKNELISFYTFLFGSLHAENRTNAYLEQRKPDTQEDKIKELGRLILSLKENPDTNFGYDFDYILTERLSKRTEKIWKTDMNGVNAVLLALCEEV